MLSLAIVLVLTQSPSPPPPPLAETPPPLIPAPEPVVAPPASLAPEPPHITSAQRTAHFLVTTGVAAAAGGAAFTLTLLTSGQNPGLDFTFGNTVFSGIVVAGAAYWVHSAFGGRGEVLLAGAGALGIYGVTALILGLFVSDRFLAAGLTTAIATVPAAFVAAGLLTASNAPGKRRLQVAPVPTPGGIGVGLMGSF